MVHTLNKFMKRRMVPRGASLGQGMVPSQFFSLYVHAKSLQSCLTLCDPMDCSPIGTTLDCPWDSPGKNTGVGCHALLQGIFPTQRSNLCLLLCRRILYHWCHLGSPLQLIKHIKQVMRSSQQRENIKNFTCIHFKGWDVCNTFRILSLKQILKSDQLDQMKNSHE